MINTVTVDAQLADEVDKELHSIRPSWQYMKMTTDFYNLSKEQSVRDEIDIINANYGPIMDTQRFTEEFYNNKQPRYTNMGIKSFADIRNNPNSRYNRVFPNMAMLVNYLHTTYLPSNYEIVRLMFNMQTIRPTWSMNAPHPDYREKENITILYYVNHSDGDTFFFDKGECIGRASPIKGTGAMYPSCTMHAGSTPTKTETRVVINLCFGPK